MNDEEEKKKILDRKQTVEMTGKKTGKTRKWVRKWTRDMKMGKRALSSARCLRYPRTYYRGSRLARISRLARYRVISATMKAFSGWRPPRRRKKRLRWKEDSVMIAVALLRTILRKTQMKLRRGSKYLGNPYLTTF
jgi:hypothetical protein